MRPIHGPLEAHGAAITVPAAFATPKPCLGGPQGALFTLGIAGPGTDAAVVRSLFDATVGSSRLALAGGGVAKRGGCLVLPGFDGASDAALGGRYLMRP